MDDSRNHHAANGSEANLTDPSSRSSGSKAISTSTPLSAEMDAVAETPLRPVPIAICGIGLRLPGGIRNGEQFWELLVAKGDARKPIPPERFNIDGFAGSIETQYGYFLDDDIAALDTSFFSMSKSELERCDPQQRLLLEVTRECLEDAGEAPSRCRSRNIGCYVGTYNEDWLQMTNKESQHSGGYLLTGTADFLLANRVSYEYDFRGPR